MPWIAIVKQVVSRYWREVILLALVMGVALFIQDYYQLREEAAQAELQAARLQGQVAQHQVDVAAWEKERRELTDSIGQLERSAKDYKKKWQDAKDKAAGTIVYVPTTPTPPDNAGTPPDTSLKPIPILEHPVVKELIAVAEARQAVSDEEIRVLKAAIKADELLIAKQKVLIDSLSQPVGGDGKPGKLKRLVTHVGVGVIGAFIGQKVKGTAGLVGGALAGSLAVSLF